MRRALLATAIGILLNIAVAWACAIWSPRPTATIECDNLAREIWPECLIEVGSERRSFWADCGQTTGRRLIGGSVVGSVGGWDQQQIMIVERTGLPFPSMQGRWVWNNMGRPERYLVACRVPSFIPDSREALLIPLQPLWLGFVGNTALFGLSAWLLVVGAPGAIRWNRRRRSRCSRCGYPQGTSGRCSECGAALPVAVANSCSMAISGQKVHFLEEHPLDECAQHIGIIERVHPNALVPEGAMAADR